MTKERIEEIVKQVLFAPQVSHPPVSYKITDVVSSSSEDSYTSEYVDVADFDMYLKRLEKQLVYRLTV